MGSYLTPIALLLLAFSATSSIAHEYSKNCLSSALENPQIDVVIDVKNEWEFSVYDPESLDFTGSARGRARLYFTARRNLRNELATNMDCAAS